MPEAVLSAKDLAVVSDLTALHVKIGIAMLVARREGIEWELRAAVGLGRLAGLSWQELGDLIGTSKQTASNRYGDMTVNDVIDANRNGVAPFAAALLKLAEDGANDVGGDPVATLREIARRLKPGAV